MHIFLCLHLIRKLNRYFFYNSEKKNNVVFKNDIRYETLSMRIDGYRLPISFLEIYVYITKHHIDIYTLSWQGVAIKPRDLRLLDTFLE